MTPEQTHAIAAAMDDGADSKWLPHIARWVAALGRAELPPPEIVFLDGELEWRREKTRFEVDYYGPDFHDSEYWWVAEVPLRQQTRDHHYMRITSLQGLLDWLQAVKCG